jgi:hypothetical protein
MAVKLKNLVRGDLFPAPVARIVQNVHTPKTMPPFFVHNVEYAQKVKFIVDNARIILYNIGAVKQTGKRATMPQKAERVKCAKTVNNFIHKESKNVRIH